MNNLFIKCLFFVILLLQLQSSIASEPESSKLADELIAMMKIDQGVLKGRINSDKRSVLHSNTERLKEIVDRFGWPTITLVGKEASKAAWLIVQHSDHDRDFQLEIVELMSKLAEKSEIDPANYAYLYDRTHKPQLYGTQGHCVEGKFRPFEIKNPEKVEERRREFGMQSLSDYLEMATAYMCSEPT